MTLIRKRKSIAQKRQGQPFKIRTIYRQIQ